MLDLHGYEATVRDINSRIGEGDWYAVRMEDHSEWFGRMVGDIALAVGQSEIIYLEAQLTWGEDSSSLTAEVVVFTAGSIVECKVEAKRDGFQWDGPVETITRRRRGLAKLTVGSNRSALSNDVFAEWPGRISFRAEYESGYSISLPKAQLRNETARQELQDLYAALRNDLSAS